jgi:ubiquinone biosynthesis protein COQ9
MNSQFAPIEFENMWLDPSVLPEGESVFDRYPVLKKYKIFSTSAGKGLNKTKIMQWIMCVYDKHTPYREKFNNVSKRKTEAARDVGFAITDSGIFEPDVEKFMKGGNQTVNAKIVEFVRRHRDHKYTYLVAIESGYYKIMEEVVAGKIERVKELRNIQEDLEQTMAEILNQDDNVVLKDTVMRYIEEDRLSLRPEAIAMKIAKGETPVQYKEVRK